jgi:stage II sporulation protein D
MAFTVTIKLFRHATGEIVVIPLEEYVKGVVASEMPVSFHSEALKAQAIAARTFAVKRMRLFGGSGCSLHPETDICSDRGHCQGWVSVDELKMAWSKDFNSNWAKVGSAVKATDGLIMTYNGNPIEAVYHNTCGGYTEDSEYVWGNKISYLRRVECTYCRHSPYWLVEKCISIEDMNRFLGIFRTHGENVGGVNIPDLIEKVEQTPSQRIKRIVIQGRQFEGPELAAALKLGSSRIGWEVGSLVMRFMGSGHGVGMCQYGADGMAKQGKTYHQILEFYYTGIEINQMVKPPHEKPLYGKTIAIDLGTSENEFRLADDIKRILEEKGGKSFYTRQNRSPTSLSERVAAANMANCDMFISIQQNGSKGASTSGFELFYYPGDNNAKHLATLVQSELAARFKQYDRGVNEANFYVLRETNMPSIMLRFAFSNETFYEKAPGAVANGVEQFYRS